MLDESVQTKFFKNRFVGSLRIPAAKEKSEHVGLGDKWKFEIILQIISVKITKPKEMRRENNFFLNKYELLWVSKSENVIV